jgi:hypothetical protein
VSWVDLGGVTWVTEGGKRIEEENGDEDKAGGLTPCTGCYSATLTGPLVQNRDPGCYIGCYKVLHRVLHFSKSKVQV